MAGWGSRIISEMIQTSDANPKSEMKLGIKLVPKLGVKSRSYARLDVQLGIFGSQLDLLLAKSRSKLELDLKFKLDAKSNTYMKHPMPCAAWQAHSP